MSAADVDDPGFLKQGKHSVGVQRQYTGSAGKVTNCQIGVSLSVATRSRHVPIGFALYLPSRGPRMPDVVRRRASRTTWRSRLSSISRSSSLPPSKTRFRAVLLADCFYGVSSDLRNVIPHLWFRLRRLPSTQSPGCGCSTRSAVGEASPLVRNNSGLTSVEAFRRITGAAGSEELAKEAELSLLLPSRKGRERRWHGSAGQGAAMARH